MRFGIEVTGTVRQIIDEQVEDVSLGLRSVVTKVAIGAQQALRAQTRAAGLGSGLEKAWQADKVYPSQVKRTLRPASLVYSKSKVLHAAFSEGALVRPRNSKFLVIALDAAIQMGFGTTTEARNGGSVVGGQKRKAAQIETAARALGATIVSTSGGGGSASPRFGARKAGRDGPRLMLFPSKARPGALLAVLMQPGEERGTPMFLLLPTTRVPKLLNLDTVAKSALADLRTQVEEVLEKPR